MKIERSIIPNPSAIKEKTKSKVQGFVAFIREQGVIGLAIGFILGGAVSKVVSSLVTDVINPVIGIALGKAGNLSEAQLVVGNAALKWGSFISTIIDFIIIAAVVYFGFKALKIDGLDKKKSV